MADETDRPCAAQTKPTPGPGQAQDAVGMARTTAYREKDKAFDLVDMCGFDLVSQSSGSQPIRHCI